MELSLVVLTPGKNRGKVIPVATSPFLIGRGPRCHLRPASPAVGRRHCALAVRRDRAFVCDQRSAAGTFVNGRRVRGRLELHDRDGLRVGPLTFGVRLGAGGAAGCPAAGPPAAQAGASLEDAAAALLLALPDGDRAAAGAGPGGGGTPAGAAATGPPAGAATGRRASGRAARPGDAARIARALLAEYQRDVATAPWLARQLASRISPGGEP
jgi:predicted component of type VI protein secretion system